jgi:hypothetical protein
MYLPPRSIFLLTQCVNCINHFTTISSLLCACFDSLFSARNNDLISLFYISFQVSQSFIYKFIEQVSLGVIKKPQYKR